MLRVLTCMSIAGPRPSLGRLRFGTPGGFKSERWAASCRNGGRLQIGKSGRLRSEFAPQAKGRVERANGTLQDRLVKEMRLAGISPLEAGNAFLPAFMEDYNRRFAKMPFNDKDLHRPMGEHDDLDDAFAWKEERTVSFNLTLQYDKVLFMLDPNEIKRPLARQRVMVFDYPDGRFAIKHKGKSLPYKIFDRLQQVDQAAIVENKRLGPVLTYIAEKQKQADLSRSQKAPRRRGLAKNLFKVG